MAREGSTVAVVGAGGKMGMRVSANLEASAYRPLYCENSPAGIDQITAAGRMVTPTEQAAAEADVVVLAVPDAALGAVSDQVVPLMKEGAVLLTLDPAAAYAGLLCRRPGIAGAVAHPCHP